MEEYFEMWRKAIKKNLQILCECTMITPEMAASLIENSLVTSTEKHYLTNPMIAHYERSLKLYGEISIRWDNILFEQFKAALRVGGNIRAIQILNKGIEDQTVEYDTVNTVLNSFEKIEITSQLTVSEIQKPICSNDWKTCRFPMLSETSLSDQKVKRNIKDSGAVQKLLFQLTKRLQQADSVDKVSRVWSSIFCLTDENPDNCEMLLLFDGLPLFLQSFHAYPNNADLLWNMLSVLVNVAEIGSLRIHLMNEPILTVIYSILNSWQVNLKVLHTAAELMAHVLSDGEVSWTISKPMRTDVRNILKANIHMWIINAETDCGYSSFAPLVRLLEVPHTDECRLFACWTFANITEVDLDDHMELMEAEGVKEALMRPEILNNPELCKFAKCAINNIMNLSRF